MNVIVIHGCPSDKERAMDPKTRSYDKHWMPWLKKELAKKNIKSELPLMPNPWDPNYQTFKKELDKLSCDKNTVLVGHSCGTTFLVRWLGDTKTKVKKLILVAPWYFDGSGKKREFYDFKINPEVKEFAGEIVYFTSDDEYVLGKRALNKYHKLLGGKIINLPNHGHYTEGDMKTPEFPELLAEIIH